MSIEIPQTKVRRWSGPYLGNYYGSLWRTKDVDLENSPGHITISRMFKKISDSNAANMTNMAVVDAFIRTNADATDRFWGLNRSGRLVKTDSNVGNLPRLPTDLWKEDALANTPTAARDFTIHEKDSDSAQGEDRLLVTIDTDIYLLNDTATNAWQANWWGGTQGHASDSSLRAGVPHPIEYFPLTRITLIGDANFIHTVDKNLVSTTRRLILPPYLQIEGIFTSPFRSWILCSGKNGKNGAVVEWDGYSATYNRIHDARSTLALSGIDHNGIPIIVNGKGEILEYDGNTFSPMIRNSQKISFPFFEEIGNSWINTTSIKARGMTVTEDGLIYLNVGEPSVQSQRQLGGVWCLNPDEGRLYLKHTLSYAGGDSDFGQQIYVTPGAIKAVNPTDEGPSNSSYLLTGGQIHSNYGTALPVGIWALNRSYGSTVRRAYFITQYVPSDDITDAWDTIWLRLSAFRSASSQVIIKARGVNPLLDGTNRRQIEKQITWTSSTTFTATLSAADDIVQVGDEIEVIGGKNAGILAHFTVISGTQGNLQTFTIDETVTNTSGVSLARFDRWKKLGIINDTSKYAVPQNIGITSSFIQFKVELRGPATDFDVKSLIINPEKQQKAKK